MARTRNGELLPLRIAMLAPPWIPVPPPAYGGIEEVVAHLSAELVGRGHDVTLFGAPGSESTATVHAVLDEAQPDRMGSAQVEADHVARAFDEVDAAATAGRPFDVVHDHCGFVALAMADRLATPLVHTVHGAFDASMAHFYERHAHKAARLVFLSESQRRTAPPALATADVIPNPICVDEWPCRADKEPFLLWAGRMSPVKGPHRAIDAARRTDLPLVLAGPIQPGQERFFHAEIAPRVDGTGVRYLGDVGGARKRNLFASAAAMLMPIRWAEPFGMVMIEAMACGTPVIAFPEGAAAEIVVDGLNGFLVDDEEEMAAAVKQLPKLSALDCRESVRSRYDVGSVAEAYERLYRGAAGTPSLAGSLSALGRSQGASAAAGRPPSRQSRAVTA